MIRRGRIEDLGQVSLLWLDMVSELGPDLTPNAEMWRAHAVKFLQSGSYLLFLADFGGILAGFLDCFIFDEPATGKRHLVGQHFYVIPKFRGTRLAGQLWRSAFAEGKRLGIGTLELFCFEKEVPFWERHGFAIKRIMMRKEVKNHV